MRLQLKEDPKEWRNFTLIACVMLIAVGFLLNRRHHIGMAGFTLMVIIALLGGVCACAFPVWFRPFYRVAMTLSFRIGQVMQTILLTLIYFVVFTLFGLLLKVFHKDPLRRRKGTAQTYWLEARKLGTFEQQF